MTMFPTKPSATTTSALPISSSLASTLPMKPGSVRSNSSEVSRTWRLPFPSLAAHAEQRDTRLLDVPEQAGKHPSEHCEIQQLRRTAVHVGAHVDHHHTRREAYDRPAQRTASRCPPACPSTNRSRRHGSPRRAHRHAAVGHALLHEARSDQDRRPGLPAKRQRRLLVLLDHALRRHHHDREPRPRHGAPAPLRRPPGRLPAPPAGRPREPPPRLRRPPRRARSRPPIASTAILTGPAVMTHASQ